MLSRLVAVALFLALVDCGRSSYATSKDGRRRVELPSGWETAPNLSEQAEVGAEDKEKQAYVIIISERRAELYSATTLERYADVTRAALERKLEKPTDEPPRPLDIKGRHALQSQVSGTFGGSEVVYLFTAIELRDRFVQILAWTSKARFDEERATLARITETFDEIPRPR